MSDITTKIKELSNLLNSPEDILEDIKDSDLLELRKELLYLFITANPVKKFKDKIDLTLKKRKYNRIKSKRDRIVISKVFSYNDIENGSLLEGSYKLYYRKNEIRIVKGTLLKKTADADDELKTIHKLITSEKTGKIMDGFEAYRVRIGGKKNHTGAAYLNDLGWGLLICDHIISGLLTDEDLVIVDYATKETVLKLSEIKDKIQVEILNE